MPTDAQLLVVLHVFESRKMSNTGHLASLVVPDCRVALHGIPSAPVNLDELNESHAPDGRPWRTLLMFPGLGAEPLTPEHATMLHADCDARRARLRIVVPDGSWSQARRMVQRLPELARLPRVFLPEASAWAMRDKLRPRGNPDQARVSTLEAIASVMGVLGNPESETELFKLYDAAALRIALMRGKKHLAAHREVLAVNP